MLAPLRTSVDTIATQASTASNGISIWCARALDAAERHAFTASEAIRSLQNTNFAPRIER